MPRCNTPKYRVQRAYTPMIFHSRFKRERLITPPLLPWRITFAHHVDDIPNDETSESEGGEDNSTPALAPASTSTLVSTSTSLCQVSSLGKRLRPKGEPGRTARGFQLKSALALPDDLYEKILNKIHAYAAEKLDLKKSITGQSAAMLKIIYAQLKEDFPVLEQEFEADWPARCLLQVYLKNTSASTKPLSK